MHESADQHLCRSERPVQLLHRHHRSVRTVVSTLRVTAGALRGRRVPVPQRDVRPTSERARQAFFNIVGDRIQDARFLDLFAGSGIFSLEAVSRGAESATAIDHDRSDVALIHRVADQLSVPVTAIRGDVIETLLRLDQQFDVVFADPPYDYENYNALLSALDRLDLGTDSIVAIEHRRGTDPFTVTTKRLRLPD
ncbi:MAG: 16S rRNA (guanine(966)-N(2))-methyltransferase RsmD [Acidobacteria bacterium]|nr:MAG: 16S rRNA (guanine(966)-N(2))-methyltransferase RsmD [Acidobacteriota bacterium]